MSKLALFVLALTAAATTMMITAHAQFSTESFTFNLQGSTYTDSGGIYFSVSTTVADSIPRQYCGEDTRQSVKGFCIPNGFEYGGQTYTGSYSFVVYSNSDCGEDGYLAAAISGSGMDISNCIPLTPLIGYVKFSSCIGGDDNPSTGSRKLKGGIIAAIVISCIVFTGCVCIAASVVCQKCTQSRSPARERELVCASGVLIAPHVRPSNQAASRIAVASPPSDLVSSSTIQMQSMSPGGAEPVHRQHPSVQPYPPYTPTTQLNPPELYTALPSSIPNTYPLSIASAAPTASSSRVAFCTHCGTKVGFGPFCSGCGTKLGGAGGGSDQISSPSAPSAYSTDEGQIHPQPPPPAYSTAEGVVKFHLIPQSAAQ